jgi:hypothetical protein
MIAMPSLLPAARIVIACQLFDPKVARNEIIRTCAYRKSNPGILVVQPTQDRATDNTSGCLGGA